MGGGGGSYIKTEIAREPTLMKNLGERAQVALWLLLQAYFQGTVFNVQKALT